MRQAPDADLINEIERVLPHIAGGPGLADKLTPRVRQQLLMAMSALKERAKTLVELVDGARFIVAGRPLQMDERAAAVLTPEARAHLDELSHDLKQLDAWGPEATEEAVRAFAQRTGLKLGNIAQPLRAALTGRLTSPPIFEVLAVLGKDESLARMRDQIISAAVAQS